MTIEQIKVIERANALENRHLPSLVNLRNEYILVSGGYQDPTTEVYSICKDEWREGP